MGLLYRLGLFILIIKWKQIVASRGSVAKKPNGFSGYLLVLPCIVVNINERLQKSSKNGANKLSQHSSINVQVKDEEHQQAEVLDGAKGIWHRLQIKEVININYVLLDSYRNEDNSYFLVCFYMHILFIIRFFLFPFPTISCRSVTIVSLGVT